MPIVWTVHPRVVVGKCVLVVPHSPPLPPGSLLLLLRPTMYLLSRRTPREASIT